MIDYAQLCQDAHETAKSKGWLDRPRSLPTIVALIHSETSESLDDYRNHHGLTEIYHQGAKPCGIPVELADVVIRICEYCGTKNLPLEDSIKELSESLPHAPSGFEAFICQLHRLISNCIGNHDPFSNVVYEFAPCVLLIEAFCKTNGIDLQEAIRLKMGYNKCREYRHGGKRI